MCILHVCLYFIHVANVNIICNIVGVMPHRLYRLNKGEGEDVISWELTFDA